jgi:hypothetical protein
MNSVSRLVMLVLTFVACDPAEKASAARDPRTDLLVGTWRLGGEREYVFAADGKFSMVIDTSKCGGAAPAKSTVSGAWKLDGDSLVLDVTQASDEIFRGSTMRDSIVTLETGRLVLNSSVIGCSGQDIELRKE